MAFATTSPTAWRESGGRGAHPDVIERPQARGRGNPPITFFVKLARLLEQRGAAAATLYTLLTGMLVYDLPRGVPKQLAMVMEKEPVPIGQRRAELPEELPKNIDRGLAREPESRFPDVEAMRVQLRKYC